MKRVLSIIVAVIVLSCLAGAAWAIPWTWTDTVNPDPDIFIGPSYSYVHDITDTGFNPGSDNVDNFSLAINLYDDGDRGMELVSITLDNWLWAGIRNGAQDVDLGYGLLGSFLLLDDGLLNVRLTSTCGDFYFGDSVLTANGNETAPVPEPATLLLLGSGLLGLAGFRRKNK
ncbi:MAG: PEP-CTERM sorting domain-containing protein [Syntrophaceae bacterium]|nr:PEP-CTERM sorting domain-containing protein [Deltaproteobacteria bacterium]